MTERGRAPMMRAAVFVAVGPGGGGWSAGDPVVGFRMLGRDVETEHRRGAVVRWIGEPS